MGEIARLSGVSISTVSRVLNNAPGISDDTRGRVLEIASSHNFTIQKRKRHINRSMIKLTIVVPDAQQIETNPFFDMGELIN
ncbi:MAG: LacI family DNA-binding transcriptional regulator, partial [Thermodesulfobacteriota bacterium]|nr:LacI family DNA-binding transcriptional regulator [Thermodesulfobacteriota bacterium]